MSRGTRSDEGAAWPTARQVLVAATRRRRRVSATLYRGIRRQTAALTFDRTRGRRTFATPTAGPAQQAFERFVGRARFRHGHPRVVILTTPQVRAAVPAWIAQFPSATVYVCADEVVPEWHLDILGARHLLDDDGKLINWQLKKLGPVDVIVDLLPHPVARQRALLGSLFWHLRPHGIYAIDPEPGRVDPFSAECAAWLSALLSPTDSRADEHISRAVSRVDVSRDLISIEKRSKHYLMLHEQSDQPDPAGSRTVGRARNSRSIAEGHLDE